MSCQNATCVFAALLALLHPAIAFGADAEGIVKGYMEGRFRSRDFLQEIAKHGPEATDPLVKALRECRDPKRSVGLIRALGETRAPAAVDAIARATTSRAKPDGEAIAIQWAAAEALGKIGNAEAARLLLDIYRHPKTDDAAFIQQVLPASIAMIADKSAAPAFCEELKRDDGLFLLAIRKLHKLDAAEYAPEIAAFLSHTNSEARAAAAKALFAFGAPSTFALVQEASLREGDESIRVWLVAALARGGVPGAEVSLSLLAENREAPPETRLLAVELLVKSVALRTADFLARITTDREPRVRATAVEMIGRLGCSVSLPVLHDIAGSDEWEALRERAKEIIEAFPDDRFGQVR